MAAAESALRDKLVVVIGGSGFVGAHLAQELLARGARLRLASRRPERAFRIRPLGGLGQVQFARCNVTDEASLARVMHGADAVVNLVGAFSGDLDAVQGRGAGRVAAAAHAAGASALVHVSAIGADGEARSGYARSKGAGEAAVRQAFPGTTILRPSVLFGEDDRFINLFAGLIARLPALPVFGPNAQLQPLFVDDAAAAIANALSEPARHGGKTYEVGGPEVVTMSDINHRIAAAQGRQRALLNVPDLASGLFAKLTGWLPGAPLSSDQWAMLQAGNVAANGTKDIAALGVTPRPLSLFLDRWMTRYRAHGRFGKRVEA